MQQASQYVGLGREEEISKRLLVFEYQCYVSIVNILITHLHLFIFEDHAHGNAVASGFEKISGAEALDVAPEKVSFPGLIPVFSASICRFSLQSPLPIR